MQPINIAPRLHSKPILGITGNSGSGKTTASGICATIGAYVFNADKIAHHSIQQGNEGYERVVSVFGNAILEGPVGSAIDRKKLGSIVFANKDKLALLEQIIHPLVTTHIMTMINERHADMDSHCFIVIDAPLLVEAGLHQVCNHVWLLTASIETKVQRIMTRDGIHRESALERISNQRDESVLARSAHRVIANDGGHEDLFAAILECLKEDMYI